MATFTFESITQAQASSYGATDVLVFGAAGASASNATVTYQVTAATVTTPEVTNVVISHAGKSVTFPLATIGGDTVVFTAGTGQLMVGTAAADDFTGSDLGDAIYAGNGDDVLYGAGGNDFIHGNIGLDNITGGSGNDTLVGGQDIDTIRGNTGNDYIVGNLGADVLQGNEGDDTILGGQGDDNIQGNEGNDVVNGDLGNDTITGADGNDTLSGGGGADDINTGSGVNFAHGNVGNDTIAGGTGNDTLLGGQDDDVITTGTGTNWAQGNLGNDNITGNTGADTLSGGQGTDTLTGDAGNDVLLGDAGNDTIIGGLGMDTMTGGTGVDTFFFTGPAAGPPAVASSSPAAAGSLDQITDWTVTDIMDIGVAAVYDETASTLGWDDLVAAVNAEMAGTGTLTASAATENVIAVQQGTNVIVFMNLDATAGADTAVLLTNTNLDAISAANFVV